jgi:hypothetical protein
MHILFNVCSLNIIYVITAIVLIIILLIVVGYLASWIQKNYNRLDYKNKFILRQDKLILICCRIFRCNLFFRFIYFHI